MNWLLWTFPPADRIEYDSDCSFDGAWCTPHGKTVTLAPGENKRIVEYDRLKNPGMWSAHGVTVTPSINGSLLEDAKTYYEVSYYTVDGRFSTNYAPNEVETGFDMLGCDRYTSTLGISKIIGNIKYR